MTEQEQTTEEEATGSECTHHWLIEKPNGPTSQALCKICGEKAEFRNSMPGTGWDRDSQQRKRDVACGSDDDDRQRTGKHRPHPFVAASS